jgi:hypothetical protein
VHPNMKSGDGASEGSLQSHSGENPNLKRAKNRGNVPKCGEANGVALTHPHTPTSQWGMLRIS